MVLCLVAVLIASGLPASSGGGSPVPVRLPVTRGGAAGPVVNVLDFGARGDGSTDCTEAFNKALEQLHGGGTLLVPHSQNATHESVYVTMPITIKISHVTLQIAPQARILAKCDIDRWPNIDQWQSFVGPRMFSPFLRVLNATDFVMNGGGVLDGNGSCFWDRAHNLSYERPRLLVVEGVSRAFVGDVTIVNSPFWCTVFYNSEDVHVKNVTIVNPSGGVGPCPQPGGRPCFGPNADGIDLVSVQRALVEDSTITAGDDCVCIKSGANGPGREFGLPAKDIVVRNMHLKSCSCPHVFHGFADGCGGMKVGTEMSGGVSNVIFEDSVIDYAGIALKLSAPIPRGGVVSNVTWQRIEVRRAGMLLNLEDGNNFPAPGQPTPPPEQIPRVAGVALLDVSLANSSCLPGVAAGNYGCGLNAGWILANTRSPLEGLTLRNVSILPGVGRPLTWKCSGVVKSAQEQGVVPPVGCFNATQHL